MDIDPKIDFEKFGYENNYPQKSRLKTGDKRVRNKNKITL